MPSPFPRTLSSPDAYRDACDEARGRGLRVGFVPTMGALHDGHLSLAREAKRSAGFVAVSIFVNPTQFSAGEDFSRYPRDLGKDRQRLAEVGVDLVFAPPADSMYGPNDRTRVVVNELEDALCGPFRPGHFRGVATVVAKLFALTGPSVAVFGKKDYQQFAILDRMTKDLFLPVSMIAHPIVRERDGLAMSSRNAYLSPAERSRATSISQALAAAWRAFDGGDRDADSLRRAMAVRLEGQVDRVDYADVVDAETLVPLQGRIGETALAAIASHVGKTRLIDNVVLGVDPMPGGLLAS